MPKQTPPIAVDRQSVSQCVYVMGAQEIRPVKIGRSIDPDGRAVRLQTGFPFRLCVLWREDGDALLEIALQREFKAYRTIGEWFDFGDLDPVRVVSAAAARLDPTLAEARRRRAEAAQEAQEKRLAALLEHFADQEIYTH